MKLSIGREKFLILHILQLTLYSKSGIIGLAFTNHAGDLIRDSTDMKEISVQYNQALLHRSAWYVALDDESPYNILNIVSYDKYLILSCPLQTKTEYVISKGRIFQGKKTKEGWSRYLLPFHIPESITPKFVKQLIVWSTQNTDAIKIEWNGGEHGIPV